MQQRTVYEVGQRVKGVYITRPFTGTVYHERFHTMAHNIQLVSVKLDTPIVVWDKNDVRETILLDVDEYGTLQDGWQGSIEKLA